MAAPSIARPPRARSLFVASHVEHGRQRRGQSPCVGQTITARTHASNAQPGTASPEPLAATSAKLCLHPAFSLPLSFGFFGQRIACFMHGTISVGEKQYEHPGDEEEDEREDCL